MLPLLHEALRQLGQALITQRRQIASGELWEDGFRPVDWRPVDPLQFISEYLRKHNPRHPERLDGGLQKEARPSTSGKTWPELSKEDKLEACFRHLDYDNSGQLDGTELLALIRKFDTRGARKETALFAGRPLDSELTVGVQEYVGVMLELTLGMPDDVFDSLCQQILGAVHLAYMTRLQKLRLAFDIIDEDKNGFLDLQELQSFALAMSPNADMASTSQKAADSLKWMDKNKDGKISVEEFVTRVMKVTERLDDDAFDNGIQRLLDREGGPAVAKPPGPEDSLPPKFRQFVRSAPLFQEVTQMTAQEVQARVAEGRVLLVDVRSAEEQALSTIRGATAVPTVAGEDGTSDIEEKVSAAALSLEGVELVIAFCATGHRANAAAIALRQKYEGVQVASLCGGAISWYNANGEMVNESGEAVSALHPGSRRWSGYITRQNQYKLPKGAPA